jgi:hypothetical protein
MISLEKLLGKFKSNKDFEFEGSIFKTHVPWVAPKAYLNIIYRAADEETQKDIINPMHLPVELREFFYRYNGARLLSSSLRIYGFRPKDFVFTRSGWGALATFDLIESNINHFGHLAMSPLLIFGSCGPDVSLIFIERVSEKVFCAEGDNLNKIRKSWKSFNHWLEEELTRLSDCFDKNGRQLVDDEEILPR